MKRIRQLAELHNAEEMQPRMHDPNGIRTYDFSARAVEGSKRPTPRWH
jgi:hypothetical protein